MPTDPAARRRFSPQSPLALGIASLVCLLIWINYTFAYVDALPFVLLGSALGLWEIWRTDPTERGRSRLTPGHIVCWLGLFGNVAVFTVALIDM